MRRLLLCGLLLLAALPARADEAGSSAAPFLLIAPGARGAALGGAYTALARDAGALHWNPAGLGRLRQGEALFVHAPWFDDITYNHLAYVHDGQVYGGRAGAAVTMLDYGDMDITRINGQAPVTGLGRTEAGDLAVTVGYGREEEFGAWGVNLKYIREELAAYEADAFAVDLGWQATDVAVPGLALGVSLLNLGTRLQAGTRRENLPLTLLAGGAYRLPELPLLLTTDLVVPRDDRVFLNAGMEWQIVRMLALRVGYTGENDAGSGLTCGFGVNLDDEFHVDYAFVPYGDLGDAHRLSLRYCFGQARPAASTAVATPAVMVPATAPLPTPVAASVPAPVPAAGKSDASTPDAALTATAAPAPWEALTPVVAPTTTMLTLPPPAADTKMAESPVPATAPPPATPTVELLRSAYAFFQAGQSRLAARAYEEALQREPEHAVALFNLAACYYQTDELDRAAAMFARLTRVTPHDAEAFAWYGVCLYHMGQRQKAMAAFRTARELDPANDLARSYLTR